jgi:hypothetical protein
MISNKFSFNSHRFNLWEIYESIKNYYPIGVPRGENGRGIFFEYAGVKKLEKLVMDNVHDEKNFNSRWTSYMHELEKKLNKEIIGTTYGQAPSFSSSVIVERNVMGNCSHLKELHFSLSLVGNFFSIYGLDSTRILDEKDSSSGYRAANVITGSPYKEFKKDFLILENSIRERFPNHKMVPFAFGQQIIDGLRVRYSDAEVCSVHMAIFNDFVQPKNNLRFTQGYVVGHTRGDIYYGLDDWIKNTE